MEKRRLFFIYISIILILSLGIASASWFSDFFAKITGHAESQCVDTDPNGLYSAGTCFDGEIIYYDACNGTSKVKDFSCTPAGSCAASIFSCASGEICEGGKCVSNVVTCTDSDTNGIYTAGTCFDGELEYSDVCSSTSAVKDFSCTSPTGYCTVSITPCPSGYACSAGKCVATSTPPNITATNCTSNVSYCGNAHKILNSEDFPKISACTNDPACAVKETSDVWTCESKTGYCNKFLTEATCPTNGCIWNITKTTEPEETNYSCYGTPKDCIYFSATSKEDCEFQKGCTWDKNEELCEGTVTITCKDWNNEKDCEQSGCNWGVASKQLCNATTGKYDLWTQGTVKLGEISKTDDCIDGKLTEYYCEDNEINSNEYNCPAGCEGGKCLLPSGKSSAICDPLVTGGPEIQPRTRFKNSTTNEIMYCDPLTLTKLKAKTKGQSCESDYECISNVCIGGQCTSVKEELSSQSIFLNKIWCGIKNIGEFITGSWDEEDSDYCGCLDDKDISCEED